MGRVYTETPRIGLADAGPSGRVRLDACARWLQDIALADFLDSGVRDDGVWVVRRLGLRVERFPRFGEALTIATWCSAVDTLCAERRSTIRTPEGGHVEATAIWVHLDARTLRPAPIPEEFATTYGAEQRRVRARLRHASAPPTEAEQDAWHFRVADLDVAGHVNNPVYWAVLEERLDEEPAIPLEVEIEHRTRGGAGAAQVASGNGMTWISAADDTLLASIARL